MTDSEKNPPDMPATTFVRAAIVSARPHVLLIHGAANSASAWKFFQKYLARAGWSNHAIDLRGHGKSGSSVDGATMADYVEDVTKVAETLPTKPVVMGWSMGGLVALKFAAEGRARACVALSPTPPTKSATKAYASAGAFTGRRFTESRPGPGQAAGDARPGRGGKGGGPGVAVPGVPHGQG